MTALRDTTNSQLPPAYGREDVLMEQFRSMTQRYEINDYFASKLKQLEGWEIVLILDDSGSMNTPLNNQGSNASPFSPSITRWDEMKQTASIIVDIASVMDKDGIDIYFLNRATLLNVTSSSQLLDVFSSYPSGPTPITPVLQHVLHAKKDIALERNMLVIIATDGSPTNATGRCDTEALRHTLVSERNVKNVFVTFVACTDDKNTMSYLNAWDKEIHNLDVVDDYQSEKKEILDVQG